MIWYSMIWYSMIWYNMIWYYMIWYDMILYYMIWYSMILYDMIDQSTIWYDMIWYDMIWIVFHLFTSKDICCFLSFVFHALVSPSIMIFFFIISFSVNRHEMRYPNLMLIILKFSFDFLCVHLTSTFFKFPVSHFNHLLSHVCTYIQLYAARAFEELNESDGGTSRYGQHASN